MTYTPNVPQSGQTLGNTRVPINTNFQLINTNFSVNHVSFGAAGAGKHKFLQMPTQGSDPAAAASESVFFSKADAFAPALSAFYIRQENSGHVMQLTTSKTSDFAKFGAVNPGWTFLPGGLLLQFGGVSAGTSTNTTITFPTPFGATPYSVVITPDRTSTSQKVWQVNNLNTTSFVITTDTSGAHTFYYYAIGRS